MPDEWALIIPVDPACVPEAMAQVKALQLWASRDKTGASKALELHAEVRYYPPVDGSLANLCCPNCRRGIEPDWFDEAVQAAKREKYANLLVVIPCCGAFVSLNDLKVRSGFASFGFARFCLRGYHPDPLSLGQLTVHQLEQVLGCALRVVWLTVPRAG